jgi:hypothetical protein
MYMYIIWSLSSAAPYCKNINNRQPHIYGSHRMCSGGQQWWKHEEGMGGQDLTWLNFDTV